MTTYCQGPAQNKPIATTYPPLVGITNMASASRLVSTVWSSPRPSRNYSMSDTDERGVDELDARTPLDRTIDRIGMGASE